jgi:hypothetical protein
MADINIKTQCRRCLGSGVYIATGGSSPVICDGCGGIGYYLNDKMEVHTLNNCPTYLILENTDSDEYMALNADKKPWYNLFISAGTLDMRDGSKANDLFLAWIFPSGVSHTAILAALAAL